MTQSEIKELLSNVEQLLTAFDWQELKTKIAKMETKTQAPDFWQKEIAKEQMQILAKLQKELEELELLKQEKNNLLSILELANENPDDREIQNEIESTVKKLEYNFKAIEIKKYLAGPYDRCGAILSIHSGQGGTEAMDWAEMLKRMYQRYFERKEWTHHFVSETRGEDAGIKEASFEIEADYAYGYLKSEQGTHRLVRLSPFNADSLRQTSFALVEVLPLIDDQQEIELKDSDLSWNFTRAGGAGGQSVNKVSSAVELTHLPTGIIVKCREERSQIQNRERALKILRAKLAKIEEEKQASHLAKEKGEHQNASWGTQIRNYVLHPYQLVKDTRSKIETNQTSDVLDGNLDQFILGFIRQQ